MTTLLLLIAAAAQVAVPSFTADSVIPHGGTTPTLLAPGMLVSIYGQHLGPSANCQGQGDPHLEKANPASPWQQFVNLINYPKELCGVQVFMDDRPAGILFAGERQINFKVPLDMPVEGLTKLRVVHNGQSSEPVTMALGVERAKLSLEGPARIGGPIWVRIEMPPGQRQLVRYPETIYPNYFNCDELEVRRNGEMLPKIALRQFGGMAGSGPMCGSIGIENTHQGRLPLHLQYRIPLPGAYEVRFTRKHKQPAKFGPEDVIEVQSAWTPVTIAPPVPRHIGLPHIGAPPQDAGEILSDYLPGLLGYGDTASLPMVLECLYHPNELVRRFAANGLAYWPEDEIKQALKTLTEIRGPSDAVADRVATGSPELAAGMLKYLSSDTPVLARGAIRAAGHVLRDVTPPFSDEVKAQAKEGLFRSVGHIAILGDTQAAYDAVALLGTIQDVRVRPLLWSLVERHVAYEQTLAAITWQKNLDDLPRLALILSRAPADPLNGRSYLELGMLPYHLREAYGAAGMAAVEEALKRSEVLSIRINCARELMSQNRPSGFAFFEEAIEQNRPYKNDLIRTARDQFPELRSADEAGVLAFVKRRAVTSVR